MTGKLIELDVDPSLRLLPPREPLAHQRANSNVKSIAIYSCCERVAFDPRDYEVRPLWKRITLLSRPSSFDDIFQFLDNAIE